MSIIYEQLNKLGNFYVDYNIISEEYKVIENIEYYYLILKLTINNANRIGVAKVSVTQSDYKSEAIKSALTKAYLYMPNINYINNTNIINDININNIDNVNDVNDINDVNNTNNINATSEKDINIINNTNDIKNINNNNNVNVNNINNVNNANNTNVNNVNNINNINDTNNTNNTNDVLLELKDFQKQHNIDSQEKLINYFNSWDSSITNLKQLNNKNIKEFLKWAKK